MFTPFATGSCHKVLLSLFSSLRLGLQNELLFRVYIRNSAYISYLSHACYMFRPGHPHDLTALIFSKNTISIRIADIKYLFHSVRETVINFQR
jgi:hypothetical protein